MKRYPVGRINGVHAEPGTILGPNDTNEFMVVIESFDAGEGDSDDLLPYVTVGYAQTGDFEAAMEQPEPRSLTEFRLRSAIQKLGV